MTRRPFRPALQQLEAREVPAVNLLYTGASLTLTGTPSAGPTESLRVTNVGGDNYAVTDGALNLGTYRVTTDVRLRLARFDAAVTIDVGADTLGGSVLIDVGAGDADPTTLNRVTVASAKPGGKVIGDVTFRGGSGIETYNLSGVVEVGGSVRALGLPVTDPDAEDRLTVGPAAVVRGDVRTSRVTYTTISGTVDGDVVADVADSPGGMALEVFGTVHGDVSATGGATAAPTATRYWYSYARVYGTVDGDVTVRFTDGIGVATFAGTVGGNVRVTQADADLDGRSHYVNLFGAVGGDTVVRSAGPVYMDLAGEFHGDVSLTGTGTFATALQEGVIGGNFRFTAGAATSAEVQIVGSVGGSAAIDLGGSAGTFARFSMFGIGLFEGDGRVDGSLTIKSRSGITSVQLGDHVTYQDETGADATFLMPAKVGGDLKVDLGNGANTFVFDGEGGATVGGKLTYTGGSGVDAVTITGANTFAATIKTGAGDDTVAFAPAATLGSATIDFGAGTDTWTPPGVIAFPVKLKNLP